MVVMDGYRFKMQLRPYQEEGLQALWSYFMTKKGNPVLAWPTGTGKSLVPAVFVKRTMFHYDTQRFLVVTHVKELIEQNFRKLAEIWPEAPAGIYSAGLKRRDIFPPIIYGGVQSMYKVPEFFGHRDIVFIDEAHLVNQDDASMYLKFIGALRAINPYLKVIGMSATPYRIGQGMITEGGLFTDVAHNLTSMENFNALVGDGYIAPLVTKKTQTELDVSNVQIQKGEFVASQLQHEVDKAEITWKGLQELVYYGQHRRSWLLFATGIDHANHIAEMLVRLGIDCASVHSKQSHDYNDAAIKAFKDYSLRAIVNYGKLTTGFDHPGIDLIGMFRPTMSVALWVQMLGRGTRPEIGKQNCLVLDFAKNTLRLGPINDPAIPRKKGEKTGELPIKICDSCGCYNHISARKCDNCGAPFEFEVKIKAVAGTEELIREPQALQIETFPVTYVIYARKQKLDKPPYIQATYFCGINSFREFVFPENTRFRKPFHDWWMMRHATEPPSKVEDAMRYISELRPPRFIRVHVNKMVAGKNWPEVLSAEF